MSTSKRSRIGLPLISIVTAFAFSAQAQEQNQRHRGPGRASRQPRRPVRVLHARRRRAARGPQDGRYARGGLPERNFGGHVYHGRQAWEGGRWRHEAHNGRYGWWWDVGGVRYFYPQPMEGPPAYVSDLEVVDDYGGPDGPPVGAALSAAACGLCASAAATSSTGSGRGRSRRRHCRWVVGRPYQRTTGWRDRRRGCRGHGRCHRRRAGRRAPRLLSGARQLLLPVSVRTVRSGRPAQLLLKRT